MTLSALLERLKQASGLHAGWDTYRAPAPSQTAVGAAVMFVHEAMPRLLEQGCEVELGPSLDGGIAISLTLGAHSLDLVFTNDGTVEVERDDGRATVEPPASVGRIAVEHMHAA